jgi:sugar diacid utilization regulator
VARRSPVTSDNATGSSSGRSRRRVEQLLAGESLDTSGIGYAFEAEHVAVVATGVGNREVLAGRVSDLEPQSLLVEEGNGEAWAWIARRDGSGPRILESLARNLQASERSAGAIAIAVGEPAAGLSGWRLTHRQARAALAVAANRPGSVARYRDVALLATALKDEILAGSLRRMYVEPLEGARSGGEELLATLRAYFAAGRHLSAAGNAIGVTRQAVARRLRTTEDLLGRPIAECGPELEVALQLEELGAADWTASPLAQAR